MWRGAARLSMFPPDLSLCHIAFSSSCHIAVRAVRHITITITHHHRSAIGLRPWPCRRPRRRRNRRQCRPSAIPTPPSPSLTSHASLPFYQHFCTAIIAPSSPPKLASPTASENRPSLAICTPFHCASWRSCHCSM